MYRFIYLFVFQPYFVEFPSIFIVEFGRLCVSVRVRMTHAFFDLCPLSISKYSIIFGRIYMYSTKRIPANYGTQTFFPFGFPFILFHFILLWSVLFGVCFFRCCLSSFYSFDSIRFDSNRFNSIRPKVQTNGKFITFHHLMRSSDFLSLFCSLFTLVCALSLTHVRTLTLSFACSSSSFSFHFTEHK